MTALPSTSLLVRTWFGGDDDEWESLVRKVQTPGDHGFLADVTVVNDPAFEGLSTDALQTGQTNGPSVSFLADETTLTSAEHPILAVPLQGDDADEDCMPFRVIPGALWNVENNINLANMDWDDFADAVDDDGVYRWI